MPPDERIGLLGKALGVGEKSGMSPQETEVYDRIQNILLNTPGHARHFEDAIKSQQSKLENASIGEKWKYRTDYDRIQIESYRILGQLPSPETVGVLGGFLYDETGGVGNPAGRPPTIDENVSQ